MINDWFVGTCHLCDKGYNTDNSDHYPCIQRRCMDRNKKIAVITSCTASLIDPCVAPPKCPATHVNVSYAVTCVRTTISFWHPTVMWQTPQRPQGALTYTPVRSAVNKLIRESRRKRQRPNKFWEYFCKTFKDCVDIYIHKCFIKPVGEEESSSDVGLPIKRPGRSRTPRRASHAVGLLDRNVCPTVVVRRKIRRKWTEPGYRPISCTRITSAQRKSKNMSPSSFVLWVRIT